MAATGRSTVQGAVQRHQQIASRLPAGPACLGPLALCGLTGPEARSAGFVALVAALSVVVAAVGYVAAAPAGLLAVGSSVASLNGLVVRRHGELGWESGVDGPVPPCAAMRLGRRAGRSRGRARRGSPAEPHGARRPPENHEEGER